MLRTATRILLVVLLASKVGYAFAFDLRVHGPILQWHDDPTTTMTILWLERNVLPPVMLSATDLAIDPSPAGSIRKVGSAKWVDHEVTAARFADSQSVVHRILLTELQPDTSYEFHLPEKPNSGNEEPPARVFSFRTAPAEETRPMSFVTGGDMYHRRSWLDAMNRRAGQEDPLFALLGGDLAYADGRNETRWYDWIDSWADNAIAPDGRMIPVVVAIGNHETGSGLSPEVAAAIGVHPRAKFFFSLFVLPDGRTNYAIDFGDWMSIICLDSNEVTFVADQVEWLANALEERRDRLYRFVCYHKPTYGTGVKSDIMSIRKHWVPLFEKFRVTAVFENDHHVYKRTLPITDGQVDEEHGVPYLGDGAWAVGLRKVPDFSDKPYIAFAESIRHLIRVDLREGSQTYTAMDANGRTIDTWVRKAQ